MKTVNEDTKKVKLESLLDQPFQMAFAQLMNKELSAGTSYLVSLVSEDVQKHQERYEEVRKKLILKYGKKDETTGELMKNEEKTQYVLGDTEGFQNEWKELLDVEVDVKTIPLKSISNVNISPNLLTVLLKTVVTP